MLSRTVRSANVSTARICKEKRYRRGASIRLTDVQPVFAHFRGSGRPDPIQITHHPVHDNARMGMVPCDAMLRRPAALLKFQAKKQFQIGPLGRGKTVCMNDHTRLRDGHALHGELEGSMAAVAFATEPAVPVQAPGTGVYAALDLGTNSTDRTAQALWIALCSAQ